MENDVRNYLFDKTVTCPVCNYTFRTPCVKAKTSRIDSKDSDFFIRYTPKVNPYFYDVWMCNSCGYTALKSDFDNLKNFRKELVKSNITPKWTPKNYPYVFNEKIAIERYKLALLNAILTSSDESTKAMISLKIAWMFRLLNDNHSEMSFLKQSVQGFINTYESEILPCYGLQRDSLTYLIGELYRRIEEDDNALIWLSKAIVYTNSSTKIKDMARNAKNIITNK